MVIRIILIALIFAMSPLFSAWYNPLSWFGTGDEKISEHAQSLEEIDKLSQEDLEKVLKQELKIQKDAHNKDNEKRKEKGKPEDPWNEGKGIFSEKSISYLFSTLSKKTQSSLLEGLTAANLSSEKQQELLQFLLKKGGDSQSTIESFGAALQELKLESKKKIIELFLAMEGYDTIEERFDFILNLDHAPSSYKDLFIQASNSQEEELCQKAQDALNPEYFGVIPIVDWLNALNLKSFYDPTLKRILFNRDYYNEFNTFDQFELWVEPLGYHTHFNQEKAPQFSLYNIGLTLGGSYSLTHQLSISLGLGYTYSSFRGRNKLGAASIHTLYLGPSLNFLFTKGFLSCMIFGMMSFYDLNRTTTLLNSDWLPPSWKASSKCRKKGEIQNHSWGIGYRLEGEREWDLGRQFYLSSIGTVDFLQTFEGQGKETIDQDVFIDIDPLDVSFLRAKLGLKLAKEFSISKLGFFIPSLSFGWAQYFPFNKDHSYKIRIEDEKDEITSMYKNKLKSQSKQKINIGDWGQFFYNGKVAIALNKGITVALECELYAKKDTPSIQSGSIRISWSW